MRGWLPVVGVAVAGTVGISGCGSNQAASDRQGRVKEIAVFAASSLTEGFTKLGRMFERDHPGTKVTFNFAASDTLATQITQGAPADVFASASATPMEAVTKTTHVQGRPRDFASNSLEIITPTDNPANIRSPRDLARPGVKVVLAAPGVPAGDYARVLFGKLGIAREVRQNVVSNEIDDKSVVAKVQLGEGDAGVVYKSDLSSARVRAVKVPARDNVVATYPIVALENGPDPSGGRQFVRLVLSRRGQRVLSEFGFEPPPR
jgi:molybdate transport system substrate-binding protein